MSQMTSVLFYFYEALNLLAYLNSNTTPVYPLHTAPVLCLSFFWTPHRAGNSLLVASYPPGQPSSSPACSWPCWDSLLFPPPQSAGRSSRRSCPPAASSPVGLKKTKKIKTQDLQLLYKREKVSVLYCQGVSPWILLKYWEPPNKSPQLSQSNNTAVASRSLQ